jgi:hypothetical protein
MNQGASEDWRRLEAALVYGLMDWWPVLLVCIFMYQSRHWTWLHDWPLGLDTWLWIGLLALAFRIKGKRSQP